MPTFSQKAVELFDKTVVYDGCFQIVRCRVRHTLFAGGWSKEIVCEVFERGHAASVLPYDPIRDEVVLVEQFRIAAIDAGNDAWLWEPIAGTIEPNESPVDLVHREAQEEAGCVVADLIPIHHFYVSPASTTETMTLFCGRVDTTKIGGIHGLIEENEDIQVHIVSFKTALKMLDTGKIHSATPIIALQWLALHRDEVKQRWA